MPDAVEAAGDRHDRSQEGVAHPDAEHGVLLAQSLAGGDTAAVARAYDLAEPELQHAAQQRSHSDLQQHDEAGFVVDQRARAHQNCKRERHRPEVERHAGIAQQPAVEGGQQIAHQPCRDTGQHQHRENLSQYGQEGAVERHAGGGMHHGHHHRNHERHRAVDQDRVGDGAGHVASELAGHHGAGRGRRAYHAQHSGLESVAQRQLGHEGQQQRKPRKGAALHQQQPEHPFVRTHLMRLDLAETQEEHHHDQHGLHEADYLLKHGPGRMQGRNLHVQEVGEDAGEHRENQHPVPDELGESVSV